jgi:TP901 family phage tail tape measure protein
MPKLGEAYVVIRANLSPLRQGLASARSMVSASMHAISWGAGKILGAVSAVFGKLWSAAQWAVGKIVAAFQWAFDKIYTYSKWAILGLSANFALSVREAAKFEKQMMFVSTMLEDRQMPLMKEFTRSIRDMAVTYGQSTTALSRGLYDILSAQIPATQAIQLLDVAVRGAQGGMTDAATATNALVSVIKSYQLNVNEAEKLSDKFFLTVMRGRLTYEEFAADIGKVAAISAIAGVKLDELLAVIATVTLAGLDSAMTMTSLAQIMTVFLSPTKEAREAAAKFGLELSGNTLKTIGLIGAIKKLNSVTGDEIALIIPERRALRGMAAAIQNVSFLKKTYSEIVSSYGGKAEEARKKTLGFAYAMSRLWEQVKAVGRAFGEPFLGPLKDSADIVGGMLGDVEGWLRRNANMLRAWGETIYGLFHKIRGYVEGVFHVARAQGWAAAIRMVIVDIADSIKNTFDTIKEKYGSIKDIVWDVIDVAMFGAREIGGELLRGVMDAANWMYDGLKANWGYYESELKRIWVAMEPYARRVGMWVGVEIAGALERAAGAKGRGALRAVGGATKGAGEFVTGVGLGGAAGLLAPVSSAAALATGAVATEAGGLMETWADVGDARAELRRLTRLAEESNRQRDFQLELMRQGYMQNREVVR